MVAISPVIQEAHFQASLGYKGKCLKNTASSKQKDYNISHTKITPKHTFYGAGQMAQWLHL